MPSPSYVPLIATGRDVTVANLTATGSVAVTSSGTATIVVDRGSTAAFGAVVLRTAGTDRWAVQMASGDQNLRITDSANGVQVFNITPSATTPQIGVSGTLVITENAVTTTAASGIVAGDAFDRWRIRADGRLDIGPGSASRDTSLYRSAVATLATDGSLALAVAGGGLLIKEGTNATSGVATLAAGTATVATTKVTATSRIQLTAQSLGTVTSPKALAVTSRSAGTSFVITSADPTDTSTVAWTLIEPAP